MNIKGIDFPKEILKAIEDNQLVVFAGAGISKGSPTCFPDFEQLATHVGKICGETYNSDDVEIDVFLGDLERKGNKIKDYIAQDLLPINAEPNEFHFNILNLFREKDEIRIVTTNQDEMLERAMEILGIDLRVFDAPALPYGNDFSGIVHLHGKVSDPRHMVFTDTDFGDAYMLNGYASRFLTGLFRKYTVLFIGYSYNDRIVRYLTTAITAKNISHAYILADWSDTKELERAGIRLIEFPNKEYELESNAIKELGKYTKRGVFDWIQRISILNSDTPPLDKDTQDEILDGISRLPVQKELCSRIKGKQWPSWFDKHNVFDALFANNSNLSDSDRLWARWLSSHYISDELLRLIEKHNNVVSEEFSSIIINEFNINDEEHTNGLLGTYIAILRHRLKNENQYLRLIKITFSRDMIDSMWGVFSDYCEFRFVLEKNIYSKDKVSARIINRWTISEGLLKILWNDYLSSSIHDPVFVLSIGTNLIKKLFIYYQYTGDKGKLTIGLSNIEDDLENLMGDKCISLICKLMESAFTMLVKSNQPYASGWIIEALNSNAVLLQRIALLYLRKHMAFSGDEKLTFVLGKVDFYDVILQDQLFRLIASIYDDLNEKNKEKVIEIIWSADTLEARGAGKDDEQRHIYYQRYNWLIWLKSNCKKTDLIESKLDEIIKAYPDFIPREHPELAVGPVITKWGSDSPVSNEELHSMALTQLIPYIVNYKGNKFWGPDRFGLMNTISDVAQKDYKWGTGVIEELTSKKIWEKDVWEAVLRGISNGISTKKEFYYVLKRIELDALKNRASSVSSFISKAINNESIYKSLTKNSATLIGKNVKIMWDYRQNDSNDLGNFDWMTKSINNTTGILAGILMRLSLLFKDTVPNWIKRFIENNIENKNDTDEAVCIICGYAAHLFYKDPTWTIRHVFCFLKSQKQSTKLAAWEGLLFLVNSFSIEFGSELLPIFYDEIEIIKELKSDYRNAFVHDYTLMTVYLEDNPIEKYISKLHNIIKESDRVFFANSINNILRKMDDIAREDLWSRWLKDYWILRNKNIPVKLESDEYVEMLEWLLLLKDYKDNINIAMDSTVTQIDVNPFLYELNKSSVLSEFPEESTDLLIDLLHKSNGAFNYWALNSIVENLRLNGVSERRLSNLKGFIN